MDVAPSFARACPPDLWRVCPHSRFPIPNFRFLTSDFWSLLSTINGELSTRPLTPLECVGLTPSFAKTAPTTNAQSITYKIWRPYLLRNQCLRKGWGVPPLVYNGGETRRRIEMNHSRQQRPGSASWPQRACPARRVFP